jgi:hypothetical protein
MNSIKFKNLPLRQKLTVTAVLVSFLSLAAACGLFIEHEKTTFPTVLVENLGGMAQILSGNSRANLEVNDLSSALDLVNSMKANPHIHVACIYDGRGQVFAKYEADDSKGKAPSAAENEGHRFFDGRLGLFHEILKGQDRVGTVYLESDMKEMDARLGNYLKMTLGVLAVSLLISFLLAQYLQGQISNPLQEIIDNLSGSADQMAASSSQISMASLQLSSGASESASSLEETSASLEEIASMTQQNAENAERASQLMGSTRAMVLQGNRSVESTIQSMREMKESAEKVSKIIKTIEEIAFQTNLLALNAAVEAARAGEHGRGFAVVAEEVRNLAQRSALAAKDSTSLIEQNAQRVTAGVGVSEEAGKALSEIVNETSKVSNLVREIATASKEQSKGIGEVNLAVAQLDKVTQRNSANAEELSSSSEEMSAQSQVLRDMVVELNQVIAGGTDQDVVFHNGPREKAAERFPQRGVRSTKARPEVATFPKLKAVKV